MATFFDTPTGGSYFDFKPTVPGEGAMGRLDEYGYEVPKEKGWSLLGKKFLNVLGGVLDVLRTGEYAMGGILSGKSPITGIKEKISPSEALGLRTDESKLWSQEGLTGLAADILLDPITYLTFGVGGAIKLSTKGGQILLTKSGKSLMKKVIGKGASEAAARRTMARVIQEGGEAAAKKYIGKKGLKWMGQMFIPAEHFQRAGKIIGATPVIGKLGQKIGAGFARAFKPFKEIDLMPAKIGGKGTYTDFLYKPFARETRDKIVKDMNVIKKAAKKSYDEYGVKVGEYLGMKVEKGGITGDTFLGTIAGAYQKDMKTILEIERATGKSIGEIDNYLRHYLTKEGRKWLDEGRDFLGSIPKPLKARLQAAKERKIPGIVSDINKYFREKYKVKNFFEPDFFKAWAVRKAEHIKYINTYNYLEATKARFGIRVDKLKADMVDGVKFVESTNPQLKGWKLPQPIVKHLDETAKFLSNEETMKGFLKVYDKLLSIWKVNVTGMFPAFHTRNFIGGTFNNWLAGVKAIDNVDAWKILQGSDEAITTAIGTKYTGKQVLDLAERFGVRGQPGVMDVYRKVEEMIEGITARGMKNVKLKASNAPRWVMEQVEDRLRLPIFINRLKKGYSASEAAKDVFRFHFDYMPETGFTAFERTVMRRLIPFYTWTRNNIPLQLEMMMKQPGKYAGLEKFRYAMMGKEGKEDLKYLPDWMKEMFAFKLPIKDDIGRSLWMQLDLPMDDIAKLPISTSGIREIASMLTPLLKFPIEKFMNRNFYFGGDIWNPELPKEMQTSGTIAQLKILPSPIKKFLNFREVQVRDWRYPEEKRYRKTYEMDARKLHIVMSFIGRYYSTLRGVFDEDVHPVWRTSRYVGGVPVRTFDIEMEKDRREYEQERQAQAMLQYLRQRKLIPYASEEQRLTSGLKKYIP